MNFIKSNFNIKVFFFIGWMFGLAGISVINAQVSIEKQFVSHYFDLPPSYLTGDLSDYCFDQNGTLYAGSENKIGIYSGSEWQYIRFPGAPLFSVSGSGTLYICNSEQVFTLQIDSSLNYSLTLIFTLPADAGKIIQFCAIDNSVIVNTGKSIYQYLNKHLALLLESKSDLTIHKTDSRLVIQAGEKLANYSKLNGLGKFVQVSFKASSIAESQEGLIASSKAGKYLFLLSPTFSVIDSFSVADIIIGELLRMDHEFYAGLSTENELVLFNNQGFKDKFGVLPRGLKLGHLKKSPKGDLWVYTGSGFRVIGTGITSGQVVYKNPGARINWIEIFEGRFIFSTDSGIYRNDNKAMFREYGFKKTVSTWFGSFTIANESLYLLRGLDLKLLLSGCNSFCWDEKLDKLVALKEGKIYLFDFSGSFEDEPVLMETKGFVYDLTLNSGRIVYLTENGLNGYNFIKHTGVELVMPGGLNPFSIWDLKIIGNDLFITSNKGIFRTKDFESGNPVTEFISEHGRIVPLFNPEMIGWAEEFYLKIYTPDQSDSLFLPPQLQKLSGFKGFYIWKNGSMLINSGSSVYLWEPEKKIPGILSANIHSLEIGEELLYNGNDFAAALVFLRKRLNNIPYKNNSLQLTFSSSDFFTNNNYFRYNLKSKSRDVSSGWQKGTSLQLMNLKPGEYSLQVVLRNDTGIETNAVKLSFTVLTPIYLSTFAKILYILVLAVIIFIGYRTYMLSIHNIERKEEKKKKVEAFHKAEPQESDLRVQQNLKTGTNQQEKKSKWDKYQMVTVLFSDIQGFTKIAESMNPEKLIDELDRFFFHFDSVVDKYDIEKIKTIGDAYMAAGGIPRRNSTNPVEVVLAALEMQQYMKQLRKTKVDIWDLRIGIHTGPVIAGRVGSKKRSYDIWGDSVNIASRMESSGEAGKVNISGETYSLVKDFFLCEYRGKIPVKYKGNLDMYFVKGLRPELSINLVGLPNRKFFLKIQVMRLHDLEEYVFDRISEDLPNGMYFHNLEYTKQVYEFSFLLAKSENLDIEESLLVRTAALLLNIGYINNYKNPLVESASLSREILTEFKYSERQVNTICNLILSVKQPFEPENLLEKILADSALNYIGRSDYKKSYNLLFLEENELGTSLKPKEWKERQIKLLSEFRFFTPAARRLREIPMEEQIKAIESNNLS